MLGLLMVGLVVIVAAAAWSTFYVIAGNEDCSRLDECQLPPDLLYLVAWGLTALVVLTGFFVLLRWVRRGRAEEAVRHTPPPH
jgi:uncharacterized BrkB/YihY/UPF0761 family membrane protein